MNFAQFYSPIKSKQWHRRKIPNSATYPRNIQTQLYILRFVFVVFIMKQFCSKSEATQHNSDLQSGDKLLILNSKSRICIYIHLYTLAEKIV